MKWRSVLGALALGLLLVLVFTGTASAGKPASYWGKADLWVEAGDWLSPGAILVDWTEPATVPYGYTIQLDGPTSRSVSVPGWAPRPIPILGSNLAAGTYRVRVAAYGSDGRTLDRLHCRFEYPE
jgi:hypothetical protein